MTSVPPKFEPYEYQPRFAGPKRPVAAPAPIVNEGPSMEEIFGQIGTIAFYSRSFRMDEIYDSVTRFGTKEFFLLFPGDVALQRVMLAWNRNSIDGGGGNTSVDIQIEQRASFDVSGQTKRLLVTNSAWTNAAAGAALIKEPIDAIEPLTPITATIRTLNSWGGGPSFYEAEDLELWMTMHFLAGQTA